MTGRPEPVGRRRAAGSLLAAGAVGALLLVGATACASTAKSVSVSSGSSSSGSVSATGASPSASSPGSAAPSPGGGTAGSATGSGATKSTQPVLPGGITVSPHAQLAAAPAGTRFTAFTTAAHSADARTLYLGIESQGGACGQYDVVVQESSSSVSVGLIHLPAGTRMCPMYVAHMLVPAKLSVPLNGRSVVDLANGQSVTSPPIG